MVYITGDIHGDFRRFLELKKFCKEHNLGQRDWIVCLGDVGLNYYGKDDPRERTIKMVAADIPANLFCIHGNHERRPSKKDGYKTRSLYGDICGRVWYDPHYPNQFFAIDGNVYEILAGKEMLKCLVCGGAYSVDKYYRLERGWNWWPDEQPNGRIKKKVLEKVSPYIDVMLTHTCPTSYVPKETFLEGIDQDTVDTSTEEFLEDVLNEFERLSHEIRTEIPPWDLRHHQGEDVPHWYFGHFHGEKYAYEYTMLYKDIIEFGKR